MKFTDAEHLRQIVREHHATPLPVEVSVDFGNYVDSLPLVLPLGASIDWSKMPAYRSLDWYEKSDQELIEWARALRIGKSSHVVIWYSQNDHCLLTEFEYGVANMDVFTWSAPGPRYLFGADANHDHGFSYTFEALIEVTGGKLIHGVV